MKSRTAFNLYGPPSAPVILLIHGLGLNQRTWQWHLPALCQRYRVVAYDLYGHGDSPPPKEKPTLSLFSNQILELLDQLNIDSCAIIGFSLGGMINRRFAIDQPRRVSALVILNSPHERSPSAQKLVEERVLQTATDGPASTLNSTIERWFTAEYRTQNPEVINQVRRWVLSNDAEIYTQCRQVLASGVVELIRPSPPINKPTLVITCENDSGSSPSMTRAIADEIAGAEHLILPALQHMGLVEDPAAFTTSILDFLNKI